MPPQPSVLVRRGYGVPFLPQEFLNRAVDFLGEQYYSTNGVAEFKALLACRHSRALHNAATKHVFRKVSFKAKSPTKRDRNAFLERIRIFRDIIFSNRNTSVPNSLVRSFRLYARHYIDDAKFWVNLGQILPDILPNLWNVEEFRFRTGRNVVWSTLPDLLKASLLKFCTAPSLRSLRITGLIFHGHPVENFITSPNLRHLAFYWTPFTDGTLAIRASYPVLTSFSTYGTVVGRIQRLWGQHPSMFGQLRKLSIGLNNGFPPVVRTMINTLAGTLECLELTDIRRNNEPNVPPFRNVDLANMHFLTHLTLRICGCHHENTPPQLAWIFLNDTTSPCALKSIELVFGWVGDYVYGTAVFEPQQIDEEYDEDDGFNDYVPDPQRTDNMEVRETSDDELDFGASAHIKGTYYRRHIVCDSDEESAVTMRSDESDSGEESEGNGSSGEYDESDTSEEFDEEIGGFDEEIGKVRAHSNRQRAETATSKDNPPDYWRLLDKVLASNNFGNVADAVVKQQYGDGVLFGDPFMAFNEPEVDSDDELVQPWLATRLSDDEKEARWERLCRGVEPMLQESFSSSMKKINFKLKVEPFRGFSEYQR